MQEMTIRLPDETVNYLQRLDYELAGLLILHTHALKAETPPEKHLEIRREFQETLAEYQMAKDEMWAEYAPRFPNTAKWWVDFQTGELHIGGASAATSGRSPEANDARQENPPAPSGPPPFKKGGQRAAQRQAPLEKGGVAAGDGGFQGPGNEVVHHA